MLCKEHQREAIKKQQARWLQQRQEALRDEGDSNSSNVAEEAYFQYESEKEKLRKLPPKEKKKEIKKARSNWQQERLTSVPGERQHGDSPPLLREEAGASPLKIVDSFSELVPSTAASTTLQEDAVDSDDDERELAEMSDFLVAVELDAAWRDERDAL